MNTTMEKRLMSVPEAVAYTGLGKTKLRIWADEIGAVRKIGARALYDRKAIDEALDAMDGKSGAN